MKRRAFLALASCLPWLPKLALSAAEAGLHLFGRLPPPRQIGRVFAAGAPAAVLVHAVAPAKLIGWPWALPPPALAMLAPAARKLPILGRLAGRGSTIALERLVALAPDLILDAGTVDANYLSAAQRVHEQTGIPYLLIDGRLSDSARQLRQAGRVLGAEARAESLARYAEASLVGGKPLAKPPRLYLARGIDGLETALAGSINAECLSAAGAHNAAPSAGGLARVSIEHLLAWAPDAIVTQSAEFAAAVRTDPAWQELAAIRAGRLLLAPSLPFGWLDGPPGINRLIGVRWLRQQLHGSSADTDWIEEAQTFHQLFYQHLPSRGELAASLGKS